MPELENQDNLDPIVLAAMIEDENEDDEDKKLREEYFGKSDDSDDDDKGDDDEDEEEDDKKSGDGTSDDSDDDDDSDDSDNDLEEEKKKPTKKPTEAEDDEEADDDEEETPPVTRKQKRQQRKEDFMASIRKDNATPQGQTQIPTYQPLDYERPPVDAEGNPREYTAEELARDRQKASAVSFVQGAEQTRYWADQDKFWNEVKSESDVLGYDPELNFLNQTLPNGKKNPNFNADKAAEVNEFFFELVGLKQFQKTDDEGRRLYNQDGSPQLINMVGRTDISYKKFARQYVNNMKSWAEGEVDDAIDQTKDKIIKQKKKQGIRPGSGKRKSLGALNHGDISRMSDEEFEKHEADIDAQINNMLNL